MICISCEGRGEEEADDFYRSPGVQSDREFTTEELDRLIVENEPRGSLIQFLDEDQETTSARSKGGSDG